MRNISDKSKHTFYVRKQVSENRAAYEIVWKNTVEPDRPQATIRRMRFACWITKATDIHSEYGNNGYSKVP